MADNDLDVLAEQEYRMLVSRREELVKEIAGIDRRLKPLEDYLKAIQIIPETEKKKGRRKMKVNA